MQIDVQANTGGPRSGAVVIAGQTFTVLQDTGCSFVVSPEAVPAPAAGGGARVEVAAAASCAWTAVSNAGWIGVTGSAGGSGNGTFASQSPPTRAGTERDGHCRRTHGHGHAGEWLHVQPQRDGDHARVWWCRNRFGLHRRRMSERGQGAAWITITDGASGLAPGTCSSPSSPMARVRPQWNSHHRKSCVRD